MHMQQSSTVPSKPLPEPPRLRATSNLQYPIEAPKPSTADAIDIRTVACGFLWVRIPMPISLDHINVYLLEDDTQWWLVDTGMHLDATKQLWLQLRAHEALKGKPITKLVSTHHHYDHAGLAKWMTEEWGMQLYMSRTEYLTMRSSYEPFPTPTSQAYTRFYQSLGVAEAIRDEMANALRKDRFTPQPARSYTRLQAGEKLNIGGRTWYVLIGAGHCPEHVCLYCPNIANASAAVQPALLAGDQLISRISSNVSVSPTEPNANHLQDWIDSLHLLHLLPANTLVLPSHQNVFVGAKERTTELLEHHRIQIDYMQRIVEQQDSVTAWTLLQALFPKLRNAVDKLLALGEVTAHLNWMQYQGIITSAPDADGVLYYRSSDTAPKHWATHWTLTPNANSLVSQQRWWLQPLLSTPAVAEPTLA